MLCARPTMLLSVTEQALGEAYTTLPLRARGQVRQLAAGWPEPHRGHQGYHRSYIQLYRGRLVVDPFQRMSNMRRGNHSERFLIREFKACKSCYSKRFLIRARLARERDLVLDVQHKKRRP